MKGHYSDPHMLGVGLKSAVSGNSQLSSLDPKPSDVGFRV